jgi:hypothetical protein
MTLLTLVSCKPKYTINGDKVYYEHWNEGSGNNKDFIDSADAQTFVSLKSDDDFYFAKDKNHVYINGSIIKNIDPNSFSYLGNYIIKDKNSAYFLGGYMDIGIENNIQNCAISGVDPNKINLMKFPWAKAGNILINGSQTIAIDDINDFIPIDEDWGKTKSKIIYNNEIIYGADLGTFKVINSYSGRDKNHVYEYGKIKE